MLKKSASLFTYMFLRKSAQQLKLTKITTSACICRETSATKSDENSVLVGAEPFLRYTQEETDKILRIVNSNNADELSSYDVSKARATKLLSWRTRHGPLKSLQDILLVDGFGLKAVDKFYKSLLAGPVKNVTKATRARTAPFVMPSISLEQQDTIRSCVSVRIGVASITWARLELPAQDALNDSPGWLTHWQHHDIAEKKLHLHDLVQRCQYVDQLIPQADCYLFENPQMAQVSSNPGSVEHQNVNIQKAQVTAVLSYALSARGRQSESSAADDDSKQSHNNIFYLRRFLAARLFNHLVGTERVSSEQNVMTLMRTSYNSEQQEPFEANEVYTYPDKMADSDNKRLSLRGNVEFPSELRSMFSRAERFQREFLGQALLLNLAFVRLVLLYDPQSIALVTRHSKNDKKLGDI